MERDQLKPVRFVGSSRDDLRSFPQPVRQEIGHSLYAAQEGKMDDAAKVMKGFKGASVIEIISDYRGDTWRAVYTVRFRDAIYVLHAFQKKSKKGKATPKKEIDLIYKRVQDAQQHYRERQN